MRTPRLDEIGYRFLDILIGLPILIVALPVMAMVAICILLLDGRPLIFHQERVGWGLRDFRILKFRTMVPGSDLKVSVDSADKEGLAVARKQFQTAKKNDSRVTRTGSILRRSHLDELPQLFNVLRGDLSLVGVRPDTAVQEVDYPDGYWIRRHQYRPGLTGPDQLFRSSTAAERMANEKHWIEDRSPWLYFKYLLMTVVKVFRGNSI